MQFCKGFHLRMLSMFHVPCLVLRLSVWNPWSRSLLLVLPGSGYVSSCRLWLYMIVLNSLASQSDCLLGFWHKVVVVEWLGFRLSLGGHPKGKSSLHAGLFCLVFLCR